MKSSSYHVFHILLKNQFEAEDLLRLLDGQKNFSELARKYSICSSSSNGGDLGVIRWGKADPDFEEAVELLRIGEISKKPVRTKFGYHLIWRQA